MIGLGGGSLDQRGNMESLQQDGFVQGYSCWCLLAPSKAKLQYMFLYGLLTYHRP